MEKIILQTNWNATVIIFDIGESVSKSLIHGETFFNQSKDCISWIIKRKIMSESKDLISLLLCGTDELDQTLCDLGVNLKANVTLKYDFQLASWEMLNFIDNEIETTDKISDWVGALAVATEKLKSLEESFNILSKRVVVFSDLTDTFSAEIVSIFNKIKESNIEITIIGSDDMADKSDSENCDEPLSKKRRLEEMQNSEKLNGKELIYLMYDWLGDLFRMCTFELALRILSSYSKKVVRSNPWNCNLEIGDLKIRVQMFKKIDRKISHRYTLKIMNQENGRRSSVELFSSFTDVTSHSVMHYKHLDQKKFETKEVSVEKDDIIGGFRYGASIIPYSAEDKSVLGYKPGRKQFSVLGFTRKATVPYYILSGEGSYVVVPYHLDDKAEIALSALIQAMHETDTVAIVRRVFSDDRGMSLGVLYPMMEDLDESCHKECFIFIELAFAEDIRSFRLPQLKNIKKRISSRQKELINDLIDEMDLMKADISINGNIHEALDLSSRHEMVNQFFQHCIVHKALYPDKPLPETVPQHCKKFLMQPESLARKGESFSDRLKNLFSNEERKLQSNITLKYREEQKFGVKGIEFYKMVEPEKLTAKNCFGKLFTLYRYPTQNEIHNLLMLSTKELNFTQKDVVKAFLHYTSLVRQQTLEDYTDDYNYWIRRLRINLGTEGQLEREYWNGVYEGNLGLITYEENNQSNIKPEDARLFMNSLKPKTEGKEEQLRKSEEVEAAIDMLF